MLAEGEAESFAMLGEQGTVLLKLEGREGARGGGGGREGGREEEEEGGEVLPGFPLSWSDLSPNPPATLPMGDRGPESEPVSFPPEGVEGRVLPPPTEVEAEEAKPVPLKMLVEVVVEAEADSKMGMVAHPNGSQ